MKDLQVHTSHQENKVAFQGMESHNFEKLKRALKLAFEWAFFMNEVCLPSSGNHWFPVLLQGRQDWDQTLRLNLVHILSCKGLDQIWLDLEKKKKIEFFFYTCLMLKAHFATKINAIRDVCLQRNVWTKGKEYSIFLGK